MSQRNVEEDEFLDGLLELVARWRLSAEAYGTWPVQVSADEAIAQRKCADELEALLRGE